MFFGPSFFGGLDTSCIQDLKSLYNRPYNLYLSYIGLSHKAKFATCTQVRLVTNSIWIHQVDEMDIGLEGWLQVGGLALLVLSLLISIKRWKHGHMASLDCYFLKLVWWNGREGVTVWMMWLWPLLLKLDNWLTLSVDLYLICYIDNQPHLPDCSNPQNFHFHWYFYVFLVEDCKSFLLQIHDIYAGTLLWHSKHLIWKD